MKTIFTQENSLRIVKKYMKPPANGAQGILFSLVHIKSLFKCIAKWTMPQSRDAQ